MKRNIRFVKARKAQGIKLGRPKGPGKSRLDRFREEIIALLKNGSTKRYVAKKSYTGQTIFHAHIHFIPRRDGDISKGWGSGSDSR
jgi:hypothetical protein